MKTRSVTIIIVFGAVLMMPGVVAYLAMSSRLSEVNREITDQMRLPTRYWDKIAMLEMDRDRLASWIPWAIGTALIGGIFLASGAILKIRDRRRDENFPAG